MNKMSSFLAIAFFISAGVNAAETPKVHQQVAMAHEMRITVMPLHINKWRRHMPRRQIIHRQHQPIRNHFHK